MTTVYEPVTRQTRPARSGIWSTVNVDGGGLWRHSPSAMYLASVTTPMTAADVWSGSVKTLVGYRYELEVAYSDAYIGRSAHHDILKGRLPRTHAFFERTSSSQ